MKRFFKMIPILAALAIISVLGGCGSPATVDSALEPPGTASQMAVQPNTVPTENSQTSRTVQSDTSATNSLVVYFSWSGNTQQMAEWVADESGSDLYRVTPKEAYAEDFDGCANRAKNELDNGIRPDLTDLMDAQTMAQYDTVYLGFPVWWYDLPMPMTSFLENYDLSGKTIVPFFSHNGSSSGASAPDTLTKICTGAIVFTDEALSLSGSEVETSETQIRDWVGSVKQ